MCKIEIKSDDNINISNKILVNGELTFEANLAKYIQELQRQQEEY